jgi:hypothetical protein
MKLRKTENSEVNYPSMDKYGNFVKFFGAVAITATLTVGGCAKEKEDSKKPGKVKKGDVVKDPVKPVVKGKIKTVEPVVKPPCVGGKIKSVEPAVKNPVVGGKVKAVEPVKNPQVKTVEPVKKPDKVIHKKGKIKMPVHRKLAGKPRRIKPVTPPKK